MTKRNQYTKRHFTLKPCDVDKINGQGEVTQRYKGFYLCHDTGDPVQLGDIKVGQNIMFTVPEWKDDPPPPLKT